MSGRFLPVSKSEMEAIGWDSVDFVYVSGDAYVDHPSFGHAIITRLLEAHEALLDQIGQFLEGRRQNEAQGEKLPLSPQELRERVGAALGELQDFRSRECAGMVEALLRCALPQDAEDSLREIQGQLKLYEDDNAEALLGGLLSRLEKEEG